MRCMYYSFRLDFSFIMMKILEYLRIFFKHCKNHNAWPIFDNVRQDLTSTRKIINNLNNPTFHWPCGTALKNDSRNEQMTKLKSLINEKLNEWLILTINLTNSVKYRPVGRAVMRSNLGPVKLDSVLPTARHRCDISSKGAVLSRCNNAERHHQLVTLRRKTASMLKDLVSLNSLTSCVGSI